jgi:hypothetical protein
MFLGASPVKPFHFTPFGRKWLQTAPKASEEVLPNGAMVCWKTRRKEIMIEMYSLRTRKGNRLDKV